MGKNKDTKQRIRRTKADLEADRAKNAQVRSTSSCSGRPTLLPKAAPKKKALGSGDPSVACSNSYTTEVRERASAASEAQVRASTATQEAARSARQELPKSTADSKRKQGKVSAYMSIGQPADLLDEHEVKIRL